MQREMSEQSMHRQDKSLPLKSLKEARERPRADEGGLTLQDLWPSSQRKGRGSARKKVAPHEATIIKTK